MAESRRFSAWEATVTNRRQGGSADRQAAAGAPLVLRHQQMAVIGLTRTLAAEVGGYNITVNAIGGSRAF